MKYTRISAALRREVRERAGKRCEYCLLAESQAFFPHEPDHLIALKHGGTTIAANLALACFNCNRFKGSDIDQSIRALENWSPYSIHASTNGVSISVSKAAL
jgi:5-methylcytosine-specific restriction endonuclease McrA